MKPFVAALGLLSLAEEVAERFDVEPDQGEYAFHGGHAFPSAVHVGSDVGFNGIFFRRKMGLAEFLRLTSPAIAAEGDYFFLGSTPFA